MKLQHFFLFFLLTTHIALQAIVFPAATNQAEPEIKFPVQAEYEANKAVDTVLVDLLNKQSPYVSRPVINGAHAMCLLRPIMMIVAQNAAINKHRPEEMQEAAQKAAYKVLDGFFFKILDDETRKYEKTFNKKPWNGDDKLDAKMQSDYEMGKCGIARYKQVSIKNENGISQEKWVLHPDLEQ